MVTRGGKRVAIWAGVVGVVILVSQGLWNRESLQELRERVLAGDGRAVRGIFQRGDSGVEVLCEVYREGDATARAIAVYGLGQTKIRSDKVFEYLRKGLEDSNEAVRVRACEALWDLGPRSVQLIDELLGREKDGDVLYSAIEALCVLAEGGAAYATEVIDSALDSERVELRIAVAEAAWIHGEKACDFVLKALRDKDDRVRQAAERTRSKLKELGAWSVESAGKGSRE